MALRISVFASKDIQRVVIAMRGLSTENASQINKANKAVVLPVWQEIVRSNAATRLESRVLVNTATVAVSRKNVTLKSATKGKALTGGFAPPYLYHLAEFGADPSMVQSYYATSSKGKKYLVKDRHTYRQFRRRKPNGYVVYPAAAEIIPRIASLWVQTTMRTFHELLEKR
jgi:hypothetical protein